MPLRVRSKTRVLARPYPSADAPADRRAQRRAATIAEIEAAALAVMADHGAGGLSLGEVARRVGMRTPSLYQYFESKNALYDSLFRGGWEAIERVVAEPTAALAATPDPAALFITQVGEFVRWAVEHPAQANLMFWRPVPGFRPSPAAYAAAEHVQETQTAAIGALVHRGVLHPDAATPAGVALHATLVTGVISQSLANEPGTPFGTGTFTPLTRTVTQMFFHHFSPEDDRHADHAPDPGGKPAADLTRLRGRTPGRTTRRVRG